MHPVHSKERLAYALCLPVEFIDELLKEYPRLIEYRSDGKRLIHEPHPLLKAFHKKLNTLIFDKFSYPGNVGMLRARSMSNIAALHVGKKFVVHYDVRSCYPSTRVAIIRSALIQAGLDIDLAHLITQLTTVSGSLPIGFPTSSRILVLVLKPVLFRVESLLHSGEFVVSMWADDLIISGNRSITGYDKTIKSIFQDYGYTLHSFTDNTGKGRIYDRHERQEVLGMIVNKKVNVSKTSRRNLRALLNNVKVNPEKAARRYCKGDIEKLILSIEGKISYIKSINKIQGKRFEQTWKEIRVLHAEVLQGRFIKQKQK